MEKKVMSKEYMLNNREQILSTVSAPHKRSKRPQLLTKKERKVLGVGKDQGVATAKSIRISPSKVNIVLKLIRRKSLREALAILKFTPKAASEVLIKLLESAAANAVNNNSLDRDKLYLHEAYANPGALMKRYQPRSRGSAFSIMKRSSHITIVLKEKA